MFYFLCRTSFLHGRQTTTASQRRKLFSIFQNNPSLSRLSNTLRCMSTISNQPSFVVSYLIDKLGFSPESALAASKHVHFEIPDKPDSVISFLEKHGLSKPQIKTLINKLPKLLQSDAEKTWLPKLEFLHSKGFSTPDLAKILSYNPSILHRSLEKQIIPFFNSFSSLIQSDEKTILAIKRCPFLISWDIDSSLLPNINILRDHGVPESNIMKHLSLNPGALVINPDRFKEIVIEVEEMEFDPETLKFVDAVSVLARMSKSVRDRKLDVYRKWGWSDTEIWEIFRRNPFCFKVSGDSIMAKMGFLLNEMGVGSSRVADRPSILTRSFRRRIVPRGLVAQYLLSKGLITDFKLSALFDTSDKVFLKMFVIRHVAEAPELLELYKEKLNLSTEIGQVKK